MIAQAVIFVCVVAIVYLLVLQRKRGKRNLEATARLRALRRWREVLEEDADPGESFVEYQARRTGAHRARGKTRSMRLERSDRSQ